MSKRPVIAIDGPSGSGKSTLAKKLAERLGVLYIDTGAMFRALAYEAHRQGIVFEEGSAFKEFLQALKLDYSHDGNGVAISVNGRDVTQKIREHEVSKLASMVSTLPSLRQYLLEYQRQLAATRVCVMEGRDIGTVVFPDAFAKIFISASVEQRSLRRWAQLKKISQKEDDNLTFEQIKKDVEKRDEKDMNRAEAPLKQAPDAYFLDTSDLDLEQALENLISLTQKQAQIHGVNLR
jgi:CMP/dCMP kinase